MLYIHGGSWSYGSPTTTGYAQFSSRLAVETGAVIFVIDYPLIPVGSFSSILDASVNALQWLAQHGPEKSCPKDVSPPLFVGGDSSGGGSALSLVMQLKAKPEVLPGLKLSGAILFSPWTNLMCNTPEYYTNAFAKIQSPQTFKDLTPLQQYVGDIIFQAVTSENADEFSGNALQYVGYDESLQTNTIASPYFATPSDFSGDRMPPLHIAVGGSESILGDSVRVAYAAAEGGADVTVEIYNGMWHVFPMYSEGCGSGTELWAGTNAIMSAGIFLRKAAAAAAEGKKMKRDSEELYPRIHYLYDPQVNLFSKVGELMPDTAASSFEKKYLDVMKVVAKTPWWVVLLSLGGSSISIFVAGILVGGLMDYGGREAYNRARKVQDYRRKCVEVPVGYVNLDMINLQGENQAPSRLERSFLMDFLTGVPEDVTSAWRVETIRARQSGADGSEAVDAARAENAAWRRMALPGYQPPDEVEVPEEPAELETLETGALAKDLIAETAAGGASEAWAVATAEAKEGSIEAARRENMAWRMQNMQERKATEKE
ncbi:unnamed protein product [Polarella glacialis]|nr:unnamed protein product [Polarella glacialis]